MVSSELRSVFVDVSGRVRSGWVLISYGVILALVHVPLSMGSHFLIRNAGPPSIDDWRNIGSTGPLLISNLVASLACSKLFREPMSFEPHPRRSFWWGGALGATCLTATVVGASLAGHGTLTLGFGTWSMNEIVISALTQLVVIGAGSVGEELFFRGLPFHALSRGTHPLAAIVLTSLIFGVGHLNNPN